MPPDLEAALGDYPPATAGRTPTLVADAPGAESNPPLANALRALSHSNLTVSLGPMPRFGAMPLDASPPEASTDDWSEQTAVAIELSAGAEAFVVNVGVPSRSPEPIEAALGPFSVASEVGHGASSLSAFPPHGGGIEGGSRSIRQDSPSSSPRVRGRVLIDAPSEPKALDPKVATRRPVVVVRDIHKWFGTGRDRSPIVRGVGLSVLEGETVFLVGPSGSGKTTLLSILGCILTPDQGTVEVFGHQVSSLPREDVARFRLDHLGFIFQTFNLFPTLSALDNVRISLAIRGVARAESRRRAAELLDRVGLSHRLRTKPTRLSTGECQRVAIARALAGDPSILLADEPTASLDAENGQAVMEMLAGLSRETGLTLVIVTHDNRIVPFADRILRLEDGRLAGPDGGVVVPHFNQGKASREVLA